jgi:hypothetical protein
MQPKQHESVDKNFSFGSIKNRPNVGRANP